MMNERERLEEDLQELESTLDSIEQEMLAIEQFEDDYEDNDRWNDLYHELTEHQNAVQYLNHCLEDF